MKARNAVLGFRRGDTLVRGLIFVGVLALVGAGYVWWKQPRPIHRLPAAPTKEASR